ncbi:BSD domain-containing protein 1-B-like isoform X1 [Colias croceus]|uniref:BSD domain-containing protein 1-B-like isoform X1 n=1 Tax=Colias crocea TaxID=72248 RepID=UPI001E27E865|nr:BSD domain-containing protein 1-B-like isoform X1 [Colias croceus]CAG4939454.1 unnamed protein product [Colias eurytheme]
MAEKSDQSPTDAVTTPKEEKSSGNWWDSWLTSAKSKSVEVYSMVKKDLDEIGTAVKSEASHVFNSTSTVIGNTFKLDDAESPANAMKKSFSSFIGQVSTVLNPEPDDEDDTEVILSSGDTTMLSTYKKELESLQRVDATYIVPADSAQFDAWKASLDGDVISPLAARKRMQSSPLLKTQYDKLVPDAVSHEDFWERYLFRVALLQDRLAASSRKQPLVEEQTDPVLAHLPPTEPIQTSPKKVLSGIIAETPEIDNVVAWEDEDFADDLELTEEQQTLLLEEYEKEITSKKLKTPKDITNNNADSPKKSIDNKKIAMDKNKNKSPRKTKSDECGNLVEDYFGDKEVKDDASANSDESWEKEFEIDEKETVQKA